MVMCARIPSFQALRIMSLVFRSVLVLLWQFVIEITRRDFYATIEYQKIGRASRSLLFLLKMVRLTGLIGKIYNLMFGTLGSPRECRMILRLFCQLDQEQQRHSVSLNQRSFSRAIP